eukprot:2517199-Prymnesium_polylepis.1
MSSRSTRPSRRATGVGGGNGRCRCWRRCARRASNATCTATARPSRRVPSMGNGNKRSACWRMHTGRSNSS